MRDRVTLMAMRSNPTNNSLEGNAAREPVTRDIVPDSPGDPDSGPKGAERGSVPQSEDRKPTDGGGGRNAPTNGSAGEDAATAGDYEELASELRYRCLFEEARDGILILDPGTRKIIDANPFMADLLGYRHQELLGKELWEIGLLKDESANEAAFHELQKNHFVRYESLPLLDKAGHLHEVEFVSHVYEEEGRKVIQCNIRDITKRQRGEEALRLSESLYRRLFETAQDGILVLDAGTGQVVDANPYMRVLLGYSLEQFLGKKLWEIGPFKGVEASKSVFAELKVKDSVRYESLSLERKDGRRVEAEFISVAYFAENRRLIQCNVRDITERRRAEEALRLSESLYRRLFETAQDGILVLDADTGQVVDANPFMRELLGYSLEEFLGKKLWEIGPFKGVEASKSVFAELKVKDSVRYESLSLERKDGGRVAAEFISNAYFAGQRRLIQCNVRDITERRRAEEALRLSESLYRRLFETAQDGILVLAADTGQVVDANPFMRVLLGYSLEEFLGKKLWEIAPFKGIEASKTVFSELKVKDSVRYESLSLERKDGVKVEAEFVSNAYFAEERRFIQCNIRDITERRRLERVAERRIEELARSNDELAQFGYVASHDLQEPLRAVASCVQLLQRRYGGQIDARADEFIAHAVAGTKRMETLIDDLLAYSRVGSHAQPLAPTDCEEVLADALANLALAISESGAVVTHDRLPVVEADPTQLAQVFQNLIGNAIKFRGARTPIIHIGAESRAGEWTLSVSDNGIGIEAQYFERIFQVFQRLHTRKEYQGTGIGLAISKKIVERHGGRIWIESQLGVGSAFRFSIPMRIP
jgi:PAS domain S-box-containing protein